MEAICSSKTSVDIQRTTRLISQKAELFITTAEIAPNATWNHQDNKIEKITACSGEEIRIYS
jgi:hypothetical protein